MDGRSRSLVGIALVALVLVARVPHRALIAVAIVVVEIVLLAPRGFYGPRESPYPSRTWLDYVTAHTASANGRVFSSDGTLFPDTAGVYGLSDLRMIDALYVDRYWVYLKNFISGGILDRFIATGVTETAPNIAANPMFDILNVRYVLYDRKSGADLPDNAKSQYRLVFQGDGVKVYENQDVRAARVRRDRHPRRAGRSGRAAVPPARRDGAHRRLRAARGEGPAHDRGDRGRPGPTCRGDRRATRR